MADVFDSISDWLLKQTLGDDPFEVTLRGLAERLTDGGMPVARISVGRSILHPVIGLMDMQWERETGQVVVQQVSRRVVRSELDLNNPFADLAAGKATAIHADLTNQSDVDRYPIFASLAAKGLTGYVAFVKRFGTRQALYSRIAADFRGASISFATTRFSGFSATDLAGLERIMTPLCACIRVDNDRFVASEVLETYLGRISGKRVLTGQIERGDGRQIDCAIFYSDMRGSVGLSRQLDTQTYLDSVNAYFDCTATAVAEHGGEILKFIGDGMLAIFPFDDTARPRASMCGAALASAREAFARADHANQMRRKDGLPDLQFGVALHLGSVIYGNVGIAKRLDFTATGPAVGLASRMEGLTRDLDTPLIASAGFATACNDDAIPLGQHALRGFGDRVDLVTYSLR